MPFEIVRPATFGASALTVNTVMIGKSGAVKVLPEALARVGIEDKYILMIDVGTKRLGFRKPTEDDDPCDIIKVGLDRKSKQNARTLQGAPAMRKAGWIDHKGKLKFVGRKQLVAIGTEILAVILDRE